jgi:outer membrane protein assembly factor BamB
MLSSVPFRNRKPKKTVTWNWRPAYSSSVSGIVRANDTVWRHLQRDLFAPHRPTSLQRAAYGESNGKSTVLQFVDLAKRGFRRVEVADEHILLNANAYGNDNLTIVPSIDPKASPAQQKIGLYAFSKDGSLAWHAGLADFGKDMPRYAPIGGAVYIYYPALRRFDLLDGRTGDRLWERDGLALDGVEAPWTASTKAYGDIFILRSEGVYHAIRKSNGSDAWTVRVQSKQPSELLTTRGLVVFEPERRIFIVDLETGKTTGEIAIEQFADTLRTAAGPQYLVSAMARGSVLYMMARNLDFCAIDLARAAILWRTPLKRTVQHIRVLGNRLYLGTAQGDIVVLDSASGAVIRTIQVSAKGVLLDSVGDNGLIVRADKTLYSLALDGTKNWEYPGVDMGPAVTFVDGAAVFYRSPLQISAIDTATGNQLWQYQGTGTTPPSVLSDSGRLFIIDDTGVKQYRTSGPATAVTEMTTLTELARTYRAKHDLNQARAFAAQASVLDPDYPPLVLLEARLSQAAGNAAESGRELARYADLVGLDSNDGRRTIDELKRDHGLLWVTQIGTDVAGEPVRIGERLVSIGRKSAQDSEGVPIDRTIMGLDPETGAIAWRFATERFIASVAVPEPQPCIYYVAGSQADLNSFYLYRVDVRSGDRKQVAVWKGKQRIDQAWIAFVGSRIFVASVVPDINTHTVQVFVDAFDAASGMHAWTHNQTLKIGDRDAGEPIRMFVARDNLAAYSAGGQTYALRVADGSLQPAPTWPMPAVESRARRDLLWPSSTTFIDGRRLFAFTAHGHAFAIRTSD